MELEEGVPRSTYQATFNHSLLNNQTPTDYSVHYSDMDQNESLDANSTKALALPMYYSADFRIIAATLSAIVFTVGFVGNTLVVIVIARTRSMHTTTNCYLLSLAVADCIVLLSATLPSIPEPFFQVNEWPFGRALCSILIFFQFVGVNASSLSITAFTIERYIAICHPMRAQTICTVSRAKRIIGVLWLMTLTYCCPWLGLTDVQSIQQLNGLTIEKCDFRLHRASYLVYFLTDLIIFYVIPFIIAAVLYCLIGRILFMSTLPKNLERNARSGSDWSSKRHTNSRIQVVRMLIVVVFVFATLWMPYRVMVVYNSFARKKYLDLWFLLFCRTMVYINSAINPILYNAMSVKFRRAFKNHLCCGDKKSQVPTYMYSEMATESMARRQTVIGRPSHDVRTNGKGCGEQRYT
ncbi:thyrotropin-releasing hormone receptor-like isoform X1 [Haliotis rubra]|uniref:thyrotropin-releasing hormone receptor-like isoform X1 n=1 Tax=Haliotis rubra TaxID=36100 RepID=UPI001EE5E0A4|nr:thyrotropin-releasing hormone receptor-like isoform X1 [Haliotis rubra]XP_046543600.1 thyrotropin-releasing hormone receptor-like isoform X1 [Haliotis rubra]